MSARCEATRLNRQWTRERCKRNATITVRGQHYCEQHAKIMLGLPADVKVSARDAL